MARVKKDRDVQIVHFSFFDLLFGAFGAFVFLMIMHVIKTMNLVDMDLQKTFDELVGEKNALAAEVKRYKEDDQRRADIEKLYQQTEAEKRALADQNSKHQSRIEALEREVAALTQLKNEYMKKGDIQKVLEKENDQLKKSLEEANQKLAGLKTVPLEIKTHAFPATLTGENVNLTIAAEGGSPPYTWDYTGQLPDGLTFDKGHGAITGQTRKAGNYQFTVQVADAMGRTATSKAIPLSVVKRPVEQTEGVSRWFVVMSVIISLLLLYILWQKYKAHLYVKKMREQGYKPVWVKE